MCDVGNPISMFMPRSSAIAAAAVLVWLSPAAGQVPVTQVGILTCEMTLGTDIVLTSVRPMSCRFAPDRGYPQQHYVGEFDSVGLNVGISTGGVLAWDVFASAGGPPAGSLIGVYVRTRDDVSVGARPTVNVVFADSKRAIALRPLSLEGEVEGTLLVGVSSLKLAAAF